MAIQPGERIPEATLLIMADDGPIPIKSTEIFTGKKVVLFAVPGAFTPTCSIRHLPGYLDLLQEFSDAGIDTVACMAVNDSYVMDAWSKHAGADGILMLADGNAEFTHALGLELDATGFFMGLRSQRFALVAEDGLVSRLFVEKPAEFKVSSAEHVLANL